MSEEDKISQLIDEYLFQYNKNRAQRRELYFYEEELNALVNSHMYPEYRNIPEVERKEAIYVLLQEMEEMSH